MITLYSKEKSGQYCKFQLKSWDHVNLALMGFRDSEIVEGYEFTFITRRDFEKVAKGKARVKHYLNAPEETEICGYYTTVWK